MKKMQQEFSDNDKWTSVRKKSIFIQQQAEMNSRDSLDKRKQNRKVSRNIDINDDDILGALDESRIQIDERSSEDSCQSYWEEVTDNEDELPFDAVLRRGDTNESEYLQQSIQNSLVQKKKKRLVKKYKCKSKDKEKKKENRFSTMSERLIPTKDETNKTKEKSGKQEPSNIDKY